MSGSEFEEPDASSSKAFSQESGVREGSKPEVPPEELAFEPLIPDEDLADEVERILALSSELTGLLLRLSQEVKVTAQRLDQVRSTVESKKKELETLYEIEATAVAHERMIQNHQRQKEALDRAIAEQRARWDEEKANRVRENREYLENVRLRREREEEEYKQMRAAEKAKALAKLEEDLKAIRQESLQRQQEMERSFLERELRLKEKELEWVQLVQELEQFMSKLTRRTKDQTAGHSVPIFRKEADPVIGEGFFPAEPGKSAIDSGFGIEFPSEPKPDNL